jgi:hypothetical protein
MTPVRRVQLSVASVIVVACLSMFVTGIALESGDTITVTTLTPSGESRETTV